MVGWLCRCVGHADNVIGDAGAAAIAEALAFNSTITSVNLCCECRAYVRTGRVLQRALVHVACGGLVGVPANIICAGGAAAIAEALKLNTTIKRMDLGGVCACATPRGESCERNARCTVGFWAPDNLIGAAGTAAIAKALTLNTTLTSLDVQRE